MVSSAAGCCRTLGTTPTWPADPGGARCRRPRTRTPPAPSAAASASGTRPTCPTAPRTGTGRPTSSGEGAHSSPSRPCAGPLRRRWRTWRRSGARRRCRWASSAAVSTISIAVLRWCCSESQQCRDIRSRRPFVDLARLRSFGRARLTDAESLPVLSLCGNPLTDHKLIVGLRLGRNNDRGMAPQQHLHSRLSQVQRLDRECDRTAGGGEWGRAVQWDDDAILADGRGRRAVVS